MKSKKYLLCTSLIAFSAVMTGCATNRPEVEHGFLTRAQNMAGNPGAQVSVRQVRTARGHDINGRIAYVNENGAIVTEQFRSDGRDYKHITTVTDNRGVVAQPSLSETPWNGSPGNNRVELGYENDSVRFSDSEWTAEQKVRAAVQNARKAQNPVKLADQHKRDYDYYRQNVSLIYGD